MKAVLMSIQPKWCELIADGEKTVEVRKSRPKLETPFKVYIYCTKNTPYNPVVDLHYKKDGKFLTFTTGKVIGEFICDRIEPLTEYELLYDGHYVEEKTRVPQEDLLSYKGKNDFIYGWHISNLKIYDKPKELSEFFTTMGKRPSYMIERPPKSWCYVEELQNG